MVDLNMAENVSKFGLWVQNNEALLIQYAINIVAAILVILLGTLLSRLVANGVGRLMKARGIDDTVSHFLVAILRYAILAFTFIAALGRLGVQTTSVIAVLGAAGLAVGLALQGSLANFAAGVLIVTFRPLRVGEQIQLGAISGMVDSVQIFSTTLRTADNKTVIVPNGKIIAGEIVNFSRQPNRRVDLTICVSHEANIDQVKSVLGRVVADDQRILQQQDVTIRLNEMAPLSLNFIVRVWVNNDHYWSVYFDLLENIKKALDANAIRIPHQQMDINLLQSTNVSS